MAKFYLISHYQRGFIKRYGSITSHIETLLKRKRGIILVFFSLNALSTLLLPSTAFSLRYLSESSSFKKQLHEQLEMQHKPIPYNESKKYILGEFHLYQKDQKYYILDVYCDKYYGSSDFSKSQGPGYHKIPDETVVNVEHTWPQSLFSHQYRLDVQKSDMHHLFPSDSVMNSIRSSYPFGEVQSGERELKCPQSQLGNSAHFTNNKNVFSPPPKHRGNVARAIFYFSIRYDLPIDLEQEQYLRKWNEDDPVDAAELTRNEKIKKIQGVGNPFIEHPEWVHSIDDF